MELNAAAPRIEDGRCQKMIQIDQHSSKQDQVGLFPVLPKKDQGNHDGKTQVQEIVDEPLYHLRCILSSKIIEAISILLEIASKREKHLMVYLSN
jgi:hypothetical protein